MLIDQLIKEPEGKTLEFKRDVSSPKPLLKSLVAFANTAGGRLIIGIDDDQQIIGVDNPLDEEERLCNLIADSIIPRIVPNYRNWYVRTCNYLSFGAITTDQPNSRKIQH